ncbi:MAG: leucine-rich repeat protein, partial [Oscillospiraceae bacterium]|nr:leucine-rich repeat protein [Oscillospiraceae bacterium]
MMNTIRSQILCGFLVLCMALTFIPSVALAAPETVEEETSKYCCYDCVRGGYSIDDIREILYAGGQIYRDLRVHYEDVGVTTYRVPVCDSELEHIVNTYYGNVQPLKRQEFRYAYEIIRDSGRTHAQSIVMVLLVDGFSEEQFGTWPNPAPGTALRHANNAIRNMIDNTHPFYLFADLFTVYVIHAAYEDQEAGANGYLGTVLSDGTFVVSWDAWLRDISHLLRTIDLARGIVDFQHLDMIQIISNSSRGGNVVGFASVNGLYHHNNANIAVTSMLRPEYPRDSIVETDSANWHSVLVHEFGHSFGGLTDERAGITTHNERRANSTAAPDGYIKWQHWEGYRRVYTVRHVNGWAVPTSLPNPTCMMGLAGSNFCGVCAAELIRRMADISGERFHGRSPVTYERYAPNYSPNYPWNADYDFELAPGTTRILDSAFNGNRNLQTIHIPASVATIGDFAFIGTENLTIIHNQRTVPQQINNTTFADLDRSRITVHVPTGTIPAYIEAGWQGFRLVDGAGRVAYPIKFEFYGIESMKYAGASALPGHRLNMTNVLSAMEEFEANYDPTSRFAFWGWFTNEALNVSGRRSTASNVAPNLRRPVVGTEGFDVGQVITQELFDRYARGGVIHLHSVWSLWGDVDDNGRVDIDDIDSMRRNILGLVPRLPMNRAPGDVYRDGVLDIDDIDT